MSMFSRATSLTAAALLVAGCTSVELDPVPPAEVEVPGAWQGVEAGRQAAVEVEDWWTLLGDPTLSDLVEEALRANWDLKVAAARLDAALARARIEGADLYPQIGVGLSGNRGKRNFIGFPIPGGEDDVLSVTSTSFGLSLDVSWEADLWGRIRAAKAAARLDAEASAEDLSAARLSLSAQVVKAYLGLLEARRQVELAEETGNSVEETGRRVRSRYERGLSPSLELRLALTQIANVDASLAQRRRAFDLARRQLELLLGRYPSAEVTGAAELPVPPSAVPPGLPSDLLLRRPDLRAAHGRALAAANRVEAARAALYPRFSLTGSAGTSSIDLEDLVDGDFSIWSLAAGLLQPVFQGGRLRAGVELAAAGEEEVLAGYVRTTLEAFAEVESALQAERFLADQERALEQAVEQSVAAESLAQERYSSGLSDYLSVLESQREAFRSRSALLDVRRARLTAWVDLVLALGGDFTRLEPIAEQRSQNHQAELR